jgi:hypothetical protein
MGCQIQSRVAGLGVNRRKDRDFHPGRVANVSRNEEKIGLILPFEAKAGYFLLLSPGHGHKL